MLADLEQAILADPDDDHPREQLARALIARNDPRGEFIALQLEVARIRRSADVPVTAWSAPWTRAEDLHRRHGAGWVPALPAFAREPMFFRGFVEQVSVDANGYVEHAADLYAVAPIRRLHVRGAGPALFRSPSLARIIALDFYGDHLGDPGVVALAASPHVRRVVWLDLTANDVGAAGLDALLASPNLRQLAYCRFGSNRVPSPEEGYGVEGGIVSIVPGEDTAAADATYGVRPWVHAPSLHMHAYPPEPDDVERW